MSITAAELKTVVFFQSLGEPELEQLVALCRIVEMAESEVIFREGEPAAALYAVLDGKVALYRDAVGRPTQLIERLEAGEIFGEIGLFDGSARNSSAQASEAGHLLCFDRQPLLDFLDEHPLLTLRLQMAAARRHSLNVAAALDLSRRQVMRIKVGQQVVLTLEDGQRRLAVLENLSSVGLCLSRAPGHWEPELEVRFTISKGYHALDLHGRIAWRRGQAVGVAFLSRTRELDSKIQDTLRQMLDDGP